MIAITTTTINSYHLKASSFPRAHSIIVCFYAYFVKIYSLKVAKFRLYDKHMYTYMYVDDSEMAFLLGISSQLRKV